MSTQTDELIQERIRHLRDNMDFASTLFDTLIGYAPERSSVDITS